MRAGWAHDVRPGRVYNGIGPACTDAAEVPQGAGDERSHQGDSRHSGDDLEHCTPPFGTDSHATCDNGAVSDEVGGVQVRQAPRRRSSETRIADLTLLVTVPGAPAEVRVFTDDEADDAARYAAEVGGEVRTLPLGPPAGYVAGPGGSLVPAPGARSAFESR